MRVTLIHAAWHPVSATKEAFERLWPEAELRHLLDDGLLADLVRDNAGSASMTDRFLDLADYSVQTGADAILFTCSAFGSCIEACAAAHPSRPVLKPNEALVEDAARFNGPIGLLATFAPTFDSVTPDFPPGLDLRPCLAEGALAALENGEAAEHDRLVAEASRTLADCSVIALAQFSLARAAQAVQGATARPVLTAPDCAVRKLRRLLEPGGARPQQPSHPEGLGLRSVA